ncbi:MAG TPA: type II toxin-antitoxin system RelE/ParE family toxin [Thermoanaerobaculia bacterium]|nr:type II toxin-antitoxin system RelE/ParE family toxin [Thermoanaerobaculia bacterium]
MSYWLHEAAEAELGEAALFYAEHASPAIAHTFLDEFERVLDVLQSNQALGTRQPGGLRTYPLRRFPYSIVFREDEDLGPQIYAVAHQRRRPGYWTQRLQLPQGS